MIEPSSFSFSIINTDDMIITSALLKIFLDNSEKSTLIVCFMDLIFSFKRVADYSSFRLPNEPIRKKYVLNKVSMFDLVNVLSMVANPCHSKGFSGL